MLNFKRTAISAAVALLVLPSIATAHHSHAEFSEEIVEVNGELTRIAWSNPHPAMTLKTLDANGEEKIVRLQILGNVNGMNRDGVNGDLFHEGQQVRITGQMSMRREGLMLATFAEFEDGSQAALGPYTSAQGAIYGSGATSESNVAVEGSAPSLFHVWTVESRTRNYEPPLRDSARAIKDAWDPIRDDVQANCSPLGMPGAMMSPHPIEFIDEGNSLILRMEEWEASRTIHLNEAVDTGAQDESRMGNSLAYWQDNTLVVNTTNVHYPYLDEYGTPQSESTEILENFTLSEDGRYLDWTVTVTDLETFTEPFELSTTRWQWLPGETIQPYECQDLEALFNG